ncbi:MAG: hypothetical protein HYX89_01095 [Chloroflexi bacterium]|nr:hypothetical protein [Chloroflexota bacterium]
MFIAVSNHLEFAGDLRLIRSELERRGYYPYVAVESGMPSQEIFRRFICAPIRQSKFCVAVLNAEPAPCAFMELVPHTPTRDMPGRHYYPNENVWFEYGMMHALGKAVIALLKTDYGKRPFDVQHLSIPEYDNLSLIRVFQEEVGKAERITR